MLGLGLFRFLGPGILESNGAVKDQLAGGAVFIDGEVSQPLELVTQLGPGVREARRVLAAM